jgi:hypothetical protein
MLPAFCWNPDCDKFCEDVEGAHCAECGEELIPPEEESEYFSAIQEQEIERS